MLLNGLPAIFNSLIMGKSYSYSDVKRMFADIIVFHIISKVPSNMTNKLNFYCQYAFSLSRITVKE
jgi:hypothetical protein